MKFRRLVAPEVGSDTVAGIARFSVSQLDIELSANFVSWLRGPVVAGVSVTALDGADVSSATERLARKMDQRIDGVLAGEITATPIAQARAIPIDRDGSEAARREGFDLSAMVLSLTDLPDGATISSEGYSQTSDAISTYKRGFEASGLVMKWGPHN